MMHDSKNTSWFFRIYWKRNYEKNSNVVDLIRRSI